jgi:hypothetical protein
MADKSSLRPTTSYRGNQSQLGDEPVSPTSPQNAPPSPTVRAFNACLQELTGLRRSGETRRALEKDTVTSPTPEQPIAQPKRKDPATWADGSPDRKEFLQEVEAQMTRGASETGVIAMTYIARESLHNPSTIAAFQDPEDPPSLPANVTTVYVPNAKWKNAFDAYKRSGGIPEHVSINVLPREVIDQCEHAPLWQCKKITDAIMTKGATEAVVVARQFTAFKKWQRTNSDTMAVAARINGVAIRHSSGLADRILLTDLESSQDPPPLLPPCVKEIYVRDKKSADAYKAKHPDVTILCLETLVEALQERGEEPPTDFDPVSKQYLFAQTSNSAERSEPEEKHDGYRQLAEFKQNDHAATQL